MLPAAFVDEVDLWVDHAEAEGAEVPDGVKRKTAGLEAEGEEDEEFGWKVQEKHCVCYSYVLKGQSPSKVSSTRPLLQRPSLALS